MKTARTIVLGAFGACLSAGCGSRAVELLGQPLGGVDDVIALGATVLASVVAAWFALTALAILLARGAALGSWGRPLAAALGRAAAAWGAPLLRGAAAAGVGAGVTLGITPALAGQTVEDEPGPPGPSVTEVLDDTGVPFDLRPGFTDLIVDGAEPLTPAALIPSARPGPDHPVPPQSAIGGTAPPERPAQEEPEAVTQHVVQPGDSLWAISAAALGPGPTDAQIAAAWPRWYETNRAVIGADPNLIHPGQILLAPEPKDRP